MRRSLGRCRQLLSPLEVHAIQAPEVTQIRMGTNKQMLHTLIVHQPKTGL
ncbi:MAG: hypothetical protein WBX25_24485 [Rhodomicrobium sp.]